MTMVILNSVGHCDALLSKKSAIYSDRPRFEMGGEMVGWKNTLVLIPYGERCRATRKIFHKAIGSKANQDRYLPLIELESRRLLRRIYENPDNFTGAVAKTAAAIILKMSHGYQVKEGHDPVVECVNRAMDQFSLSIQPGAFLVDIMPWLRYVPAWMPGASFQRQASSWRETLQAMADVPHNFVKEQIAAGTAIPSLTSQYIDGQEISAQEEDIVKWAAASLYSGGADTTVSATSVFFLAMTLHPDAQAKAQAEIDAVVGSDRLPTIEDREQLPYVDALVKEIFRWKPVANLIPRRLSEDDVHEGCFIPKGSLIFVNVWQILHDERVYADPLEFKPERFLKTENHIPERDPLKAGVFGFGRRGCPGADLAGSSVWLYCAMALSVFNIRKALDKDGKPVSPSGEMTGGTVSHPKPFVCNIEARSSKAQSLITSVEFAADS